MNSTQDKWVSTQDIGLESFAATQESTGTVAITVTENAKETKLDTAWVYFFYRSGRPSLWAYFGPDNGRPVRAVYLGSRVPLDVGMHKIRPMKDPDWEVLGLLGNGTPGAVIGEDWGSGTLKIDALSPLVYSGSFNFKYRSFADTVVEVVGEFSLENR
jgi:hypothetical protein